MSKIWERYCRVVSFVLIMAYVLSMFFLTFATQTGLRVVKDTAEGLAESIYGI